MKKPFPKPNQRRRTAPPTRLDRRVVVIDRARHQLGGKLRVVDAVKISLVDLNTYREVEVSYALRLEGFIGAAFAKKYEVVKALKEGNFESLLKDLDPIPEALPVTPTPADAPLNDTMEHLVAKSDPILAENAASPINTVTVAP